VHPLQGKVLLIDDDASIRRALHTTLSALGFEIEEASSGEQAVSFVRTERYDAVLLDVNMPGMGGIETCRMLRQSGRGPPHPVC
jgi:two-component system KDP operon response regulator KdpE